MNTNQVANLNTVNLEDEGKLMRVIVVDSAVEWATPAAFNTFANHVTNIQAKLEFPIPAIFEMTPGDTKAKYQDTPWAEAFVAKAKKSFEINVKSNLDLHRKIQTLKSEGELGLILIYDSGCMVGYTPEGTTKVRPFAMSVISPESYSDNDGTAKRGATNIRFSFRDSRQFDLWNMPVYPELASTPWSAIELECLVGVDVTVVGTPTATTIVVDVLKSDSRNAGSNGAFATPIDGLIAADFAKLTALLVPEVVTCAPVAGVSGRYTLSGTGLVTGPVGLKVPSLMTTKGFEGSGYATVTIA